MRFLVPFVLISALDFSWCPWLVTAVGINYGQIADNLPSPEKAVTLVQSIGVKKVKLYDADPAVLRAFAKTGVEFIVCIPNECLATVKNNDKAVAWVKDNVQSYLPATNITSITVGNEILSGNKSAMMVDLLPAMQSVYKAVVALGLDKQVAVTTAHSLAVLKTSYPPSAGTFRPELIPYIDPILAFHSKTGSPFLINAYPYFAYKASPKQISLDFVLFQPNQGMVDSVSKLKYNNMLHAQIDSVYAAMEKLGVGRGVRVQISETGWPSTGDADEAGATQENARKYNGNLLKLVGEEKGTPMRPDEPLDVFVFALFNENLKPGPTSERNYGLFKPDGMPAYQLGVNSSNVSSGSDDVGDGDVAPTSPTGGGMISGLLTFSSAEVNLITSTRVMWTLIIILLL